MEGYEKLCRCVEIIRSKTDMVSKIAIVLGSGLGQYAEHMKIVQRISYSEIEGFPVSTVAGHDGSFLFGYMEGIPVVMMKGRIHYYEGYAMSDVVLPIRIMGLLGAKQLLLTNAAGGVSLDFEPGDLMLITDHIGMGVPSPLRGPNMDNLGTRFPDMSNVYDKTLQKVIKKVALRLGVSLKEGVYMQCPGPAYETPAEVRMLRSLGVSAVGMSTACEAIAGVHIGMQVCGISCITNMAAGITKGQLSHKEVQETADRVKDTFEKLVTEVLKEILL